MFRTVIQNGRVFLVFVCEDLRDAYWDAMFCPNGNPDHARREGTRTIELDATDLTHRHKLWPSHHNDN